MTLVQLDVERTSTNLPAQRQTEGMPAAATSATTQYHLVQLIEIVSTAHQRCAKSNACHALLLKYQQAAGTNLEC
jgi:hypothetical protein